MAKRIFFFHFCVFHVVFIKSFGYSKTHVWKICIDFFPFNKLNQETLWTHYYMEEFPLFSGIVAGKCLGVRWFWDDLECNKSDLRLWMIPVLLVWWKMLYLYEESDMIDSSMQNLRLLQKRIEISPNWNTRNSSFSSFLQEKVPTVSKVFLNARKRA